MSRTDVHTPYWVKARSPEWRSNFAEFHDHRDGVCDLDEYLAARQWIRTRCRIDLALIDGNVNCGCRMCTGHDARKYNRRRQRTALRAQLRRAAKTPDDDRDTIDIPADDRMTAWIAQR